MSEVVTEDSKDTKVEPKGKKPYTTKTVDGKDNKQVHTAIRMTKFKQRLVSEINAVQVLADKPYKCKISESKDRITVTYFGKGADELPTDTLNHIHKYPSAKRTTISRQPGRLKVSVGLDSKASYYDKRKARNFAASSKLEGLVVEVDPKEKDLKKVIEKYKKPKE